MCTSAVWGQKCFLIEEGSGCSLLAARWQTFLVSFLSSLRTHIWANCNVVARSFLYQYSRQYFISQLASAKALREEHALPVPETGEGPKSSK